MPLKSEKQRRFLFSELNRRKKGKSKLKGLSTAKLKEMARSPLMSEAKRKNG